jgi:TolA-binding protein
MILLPDLRRRTAPMLLAAGIGLAVLAAPGAARAQVDSREGIALQNQILELKRQVQTLQEQQSNRPSSGGGGSFLGIGGSSAPAPSSGGGDMTAQLLDRVQTLEDQVRRLRGRVDELGNQLQQQNADLTKQIGDINFALQNGGAAGAGAAAPARPAGAAPAAPAAAAPAAAVAPAAPARRTPEMVMQQGNAALARRDYATAEAAAREVLADKNSPRAYDAQMLLAQALAGKRTWGQAAIAYDDAYNRSPKGTHAQDALLGLANSLIAINEKKAACETLAKFHQNFPTPRPDLREQVTSAGQRAGCH